MDLGLQPAASMDAEHRQKYSGTWNLFPDDYIAELERSILVRANKRMAKKSTANQSFLLNMHDLRLVYLLEVCLDRLKLEFGNVVILAPRQRYGVLGTMMTHYIRGMPVRGIASLNLLILARALQKSGHVYVGDVIQLRREELELHAVAVNRVKDPARLAAHFERLLGASDLSLGMKAPGWTKPRLPSFERQLHERDARNEREERRQTPSHLQLVRD